MTVYRSLGSLKWPTPTDAKSKLEEEKEATSSQSERSKPTTCIKMPNAADDMMNRERLSFWQGEIANFLKTMLRIQISSLEQLIL